MGIYNLLSGALEEAPVRKERSSKSSVLPPPGCQHCPLSEVPIVNSVKGLSRIRQRKAMLWAQSPGRNENRVRRELIGEAGNLLWEAAALEGLTRNDFDIQNVLRCWPIAWEGTDYKEHPPTKVELHCCSIYNEQALERNDQKAAVHLVLGRVAGVQLLGKAYRKDNPIFWHEPWNAYVVVADHPSYILRSGGKKSGWLYEEFCLKLRAVKAILTYPGRWGYVHAQGYRFLSEAQEVEEFLRKELPRCIAKYGYAAADIEADGLDDATRLLMISFAYGRYADVKKWNSWCGQSTCIFLDHPENTALARPKDRERVLGALKDVLEDSKPQKSFHHGSSDAEQLQKLLGIHVRGYDHDSQYVAYLQHPQHRTYALNSMAQCYFPEFGDYKTMTAGYDNYANIPLKQLALYNCADSDLSARIIAQAPLDRFRALSKVYTHAAFTLEKMEQRGPLLDISGLAKVERKLDKQVEHLDEQLKQVAGDPSFNPGSPKQIAVLLFDKLGLPETANRTTADEALAILSVQSGSKVPKLVQDYRYLSKAKSTYLSGYRRSAEMHGGELRTHWYLTGAATGRLRSGGKEDGYEGVVNFQNFHGSPLLLNLLTSDLEWRRVLNAQAHASLDDLQVFLSLDYSQVEIRVLAEVSGDALLIKQFNSGQDIHCLVGHELTGWPVEKIAKDKKTRKLIKNLHFGVVYGIGKEGLYDYLVAKGVTNVSPRRAAALHDAYFHKYVGVRKFVDAMRQSAETKGYVDNIFGFRRQIGTWDPSRTTYWGNQAINTPIQGSAHHLLVIAMALLHMRPKTYNLLQTLIMEGHDALVWRLPLHQLKAAAEQAANLLQEAVPTYTAKYFGRKLKVPLIAEASAGFLLGAMVDYKDQELLEFLTEWPEKYREQDKKGWQEMLPDTAVSV